MIHSFIAPLPDCMASVFGSDMRVLSTPPPNGKLKVAYLSSDFNEHPVAYLSVEMFELHDRNKFEVYAFSHGLSTEESDFRDRLESAFDHFHDVSSLTDVEIADKIQQLGIHIAVDLNGYTANARTGILSSRPAPVQVSFIGFPGTMAVPFIDYLIADEKVIPKGERPAYSEYIAYLPHCYLPQDRRRRIAAPAPSRESVGLPDDAFVFCCFNSAHKITSQQFDVWCDILRACPQSVIWLAEGNRWSAQNLRKEAVARDIDPKRLVFAPKLTTITNEEHLSRVSLADLFLDTYPYSAHATGCDSLWVGVPVLTRTGHSFASRVSASLLNAVNLSELIAQSDGQYKALAIELTNNPEKIRKHRTTLKNSIGSAPLFDTPSYVTALESLYSKMWAKVVDEQRPEDLYSD